MGTPYTFDEGMSCHLTRIELFYFDDNFRRIAQWVPPLVLSVSLSLYLSLNVSVFPSSTPHSLDQLADCLWEMTDY